MKLLVSILISVTLLEITYAHLQRCPKYGYYSQCTSNILAPTCKRLYYNPNDTSGCAPGCACRKNFVFDEESGQCVCPTQCPQVGKCGPNSSLDYCRRCSSAQKTCTNYRDPEPIGCADGCFIGCFCNEGYVYDELKKICVRPSECPPRDEPVEPPKCLPNSHYTNCTSKTAPTCNNLFFHTYRQSDCSPGCECNKHFVYDEELRICVRPADCPNCGKCGPHASIDYCRKCSPYQKTCSNYLQPLLDDCEEGCFVGCFCHEGYVYDERKKLCVRPQECISSDVPTIPNCPPNSYFTKCISKKSAPTCKSLYYNRRDIENCGPGCLCNKYFVYDEDTGKCVRPNECPNLGKCGPNSSLDFCRKCSTYQKTCANLRSPQPVGCAPGCFIGCFCNDGFVFDESRKLCVRPQECINQDETPVLPSCPPNSHYSKCISKNSATCKNLYYNSQDKSDCKAACVCDNHFVFDEETSKCVHPYECPNFSKCGPYSRLEFCHPCSNYQKTCSNFRRPQPVGCAAGCFIGCFCIEGFVFDESKKLCVRPQECISQDVPDVSSCPRNSHYSTCVSKHTASCTDLFYNPHDTSNCTSGCVCNKNYVYDEEAGECIHVSECPKVGKCGPNSSLDFCRSCSSYQKTCANYRMPRPVGCAQGCFIGCFCNDGFVYDESKKLCVRPQECPPRDVPITPNCPINSHFSTCVSKNSATCTNLYYDSFDTSNCTSGCVCNKNFVYNEETGECIHPTRCPNVGECGPHSSIDFCRSCSTYQKTCLNLRNPRPVGCAAGCFIGCFCDEGYVYDELKKFCVLPRECTPRDVPDNTPSCPPNSHYSTCVSKHSATCNNLYYNDLDDSNCKPGCVCNKNLVYNEETGQCVHPTECPNFGKCGPNSSLDFCRACSTYQLTCSNFRNPRPIGCVAGCFIGCFCNDGYVFDEIKKVCVKSYECIPRDVPETPNCPVNSHYSTCIAKNSATCNSLYYNPLDTSDCKSGCVCNTHFVYQEETGQCVHPSQCVNVGKCGPNSSLDFCRKCSTYRKTCLNMNSPRPTGCSPGCFIGCFCNDGYVYDETKKMCVLPKDCPSQDVPETSSCPANSHYSQCVSKNLATCTKLYYNPYDSSNCKPGCACNKNFVYNEQTGECVHPTECSNVGICRPHSSLDFCRPCSTYQKTCTNMNIPKPRGCAPGCFIGCFCNDGYVYDEIKKMCVRPQDCPAQDVPETPSCPENSHYSTCVSKNSATCRKLYYNPYDTSNCSPGCVCNKNFVYNEETGECVRPTECPNVGICRPHSSLDFCRPCSTYQKTCANLNIPKPQGCAPGCFIGCFCNDGYVYDEIKKMCVKPQDCPAQDVPETPSCPMNSHYSSCVSKNSATCRKLYYNPHDTSNCSPGCVCNKNFVYDEETGECVHPTECPNVGICRPHSSLDFCRPCSTYQKTCANMNIPKPQGCAPGCFIGCFCNDGYVYDEIKKMCVKPQDCPAQDVPETPSCPINSHYSTCVSKNSATCRKLYYNPYDTSNCSPGCVCNKNFVFNEETGECVHPTECPNVGKCRPYSSLDFCRPCSTYQKTCTNLNIPMPVGCAAGCFIGCFCNDGYVFDETKKLCVRPQDCVPRDDPEPQKCAPNSHYTTCVSNKVQPTCKNFYYIRGDPTDCTPGCICDDNFVFDEDLGKCVAPTDCPNFCKCGPNASLDFCRLCSVTQKTCKNYRKKPLLNCTDGCYIGCFCNKGYVLDEDRNLCVRPYQCEIEDDTGEDWDDDDVEEKCDYVED